MYITADMGGVKMRTTHRMNSDTFNQLIKLGVGLKKKKKKGKKVRHQHEGIICKKKKLQIHFS